MAISWKITFELISTDFDEPFEITWCAFGDTEEIARAKATKEVEIDFSDYKIGKITNVAKEDEII